MKCQVSPNLDIWVFRLKRLSPVELRLKIKEMINEQNLLDQAIAYFSHYGEPPDFTGIRQFLVKRQDFLKEDARKYQTQLNELTLTNLVTNRIE